MDRTQTQTDYDDPDFDKPEDLSGTVLDRFELRRRVGAGATAEVYEAFDVVDRNRVAIKVLSAGRSGASGWRDRFFDELRLAREIEHPNLLLPYIGGIARGRPFLVSEFVDAQALDDLIRDEGPMKLDDCVELAQDLGPALDALHARGLIHRDVKPSNVLVVNDFGRRRFRLTDLGVGLWLIRSGVETAGIGTAGFCSPEQISGKPLDKRTDVFSLACTLYAALVGVPPWNRSSRQLTLEATLNEPAPRPSAGRPGLPPAVDAALLRGLEPRPADRYRSAGAAVEGLKRAVANEGVPVTAHRQSSSGRSAPRPPELWQPPPPTSPAPLAASSWTVRSPRWWNALAMVIGASGVIGAAAIAFAGRGDLVGPVITSLTLMGFAIARPMTVGVMSCSPGATEDMTRAVAEELDRQTGWSAAGSSGARAKVKGPAGHTESLSLCVLLLAGILPGLMYLIATALPARVSIQAHDNGVRMRGWGTAAAGAMATASATATGLQPGA